MTLDTYRGGEAHGACAAGYHFASIWEILDPTQLEYDPALGDIDFDSGSGPTCSSGWIRTGLDPGERTCQQYTSSSAQSRGVLANLACASLVNPAMPSSIFPWRANAEVTCNFLLQVWCVQD